MVSSRWISIKGERENHQIVKPNRGQHLTSNMCKRLYSQCVHCGLVEKRERERERELSFVEKSVDSKEIR